MFIGGSILCSKPTCLGSVSYTVMLIFHLVERQTVCLFIYHKINGCSY